MVEVFLEIWRISVDFFVFPFFFKLLSNRINCSKNCLFCLGMAETSVPQVRRLGTGGKPTSTPKKLSLNPSSASPTVSIISPILTSSHEF